MTTALMYNFPMSDEGFPKDETDEGGFESKRAERIHQCESTFSSLCEGLPKTLEVEKKAKEDFMYTLDQTLEHINQSKLTPGKNDPTLDATEALYKEGQTKFGKAAFEEAMWDTTALEDFKEDNEKSVRDFLHRDHKNFEEARAEANNVSAELAKVFAKVLEDQKAKDAERRRIIREDLDKHIEKVKITNENLIAQAGKNIEERERLRMSRLSAYKFRLNGFTSNTLDAITRLSISEERVARKIASTGQEMIDGAVYRYLGIYEKQSA